MLQVATPTVLKTVLRQVMVAGLGLALPTVAAAQTIYGFTPSTAAAGETVTITGTNLNALKSVMINGQPMRTTGTLTAKSVQVIVPPAVATGRIRLTTSKGTAITTSKLGITRQSSAVSYGQMATSTVATATNNYSTPTMGDLDNDGLIDLMLGQGNGTIMCYEQAKPYSPNFGTGTLLKNSDGTTLTVGAFAKPTLTDLDGNGLLELLVGEDTGTVLRYEQVGATGANALLFTKTTLLTNPFGKATSSSPNGGSYARPTVADLDNNGLLDVLVGSNDGTLRRYEQTAANALTFTTIGLMKTADGKAIDAGDVDKPLLTDYDGDGYLDMLLGNKAGSIVLYTQTGVNEVTFKSLGTLTTNGTTAVNMSSVGGYAAPAITDIDGDGLLDLYVGNGNGTVYRFEQTQSATIPTLNPVALPVTLTSFTGQVAATANVLSWTTASEKNSARFVVERSADGADFAALGAVAAAGTSSAPLSYSYADATALTAGAAYYRLRQEDLDGTVAYSPVVALTRTTAAASAAATTAAKPVAYPSPFAETLSVTLPGAATAVPATATLFTLAGQPVYTHTLQLSSDSQALPELPTLPTGLYVLRLATATGTTTQKVTRQ